MPNFKPSTGNWAFLRASSGRTLRTSKALTTPSRFGASLSSRRPNSFPVSGAQIAPDIKIFLNNWGKSCIVALSANNWWERSPNASNTTNFCNVNSNGNANNNNASNSNGVAFGFRLFPGETE